MAVETNGVPVIMGNDNGFGNGGMGFWGFLILAMFLWGGNGFGIRGNGECNNNANAIQADINRGFDNQNTIGNQREILSAITSGTAQSVAASNQMFHDTLTVLNDKYSELVRDIGAVNLAQERALAKQNECCCETLRAIDGVNYNNAINTAAINANTTAQTQKILDAICQNKIESLQGQVSDLRLQNMMAGVVRYPNATTFTAGVNPFFSNNGCYNGCCNGVI